LSLPAAGDNLPADMSPENTRAADGIDVAYVARLARLYLTDEERQTFQSQLEHVVQYVHQIRELNVEGIEPMSHAIAVQNVFRPDVVKPGLDRDAVLANAPARVGDQFMVPKILE
jgi:aspartyl-tRNA(Asn)/glutamyl-tRNA(Gln) amidotransferase subunit C